MVYQSSNHPSIQQLVNLLKSYLIPLLYFIYWFIVY